ncbi:MAG: hypothetical protein ACXABO_04100 [Promethearchaeota archaeon]|jgi:Ras-related protein Rab-1A
MSPLLTYDICLLASKGVNKETLVKHFINRILKEEYKIKIGVDLPIKTLHQKIKFQFWIFSYDFITNNEKWEEIVSKRIRNSSGIIIMYDFYDDKTLDWVSNKFQIIKNNLKYTPPTLLIGNKPNLEDNRDISETISEEFLHEVKKRNDITSLMEISLKTGKNVEKAFEKLTSMILQNTKLDYKIEVKKVISLKGNKYITIPIILSIIATSILVSTILYFFIYVFQ